MELPRTKLFNGLTYSEKKPGCLTIIHMALHDVVHHYPAKVSPISLSSATFAYLLFLEYAKHTLTSFTLHLFPLPRMLFPTEKHSTLPHLF